MSDGPRLLVPDPEKRIVSPDEAKRIADANAKYGPGGKRIAPPADYMSDRITREEAMTHAATAAAVAVNRAMEELDDALGDRLEAMEQVIFENVLRALERRTLRYRLVMWVRGYLTELGLIEPVMLSRPVDAVEALDPNVAAAASAAPTDEQPLVWREYPSGIDAVGVKFVEAGGGVAIVRRPGSGEWFMITSDTPTLARAGRMLGGENPTFEEGMTSALLDLEFLQRARAIIAQQDGTQQVVGPTEQ